MATAEQQARAKVYRDAAIEHITVARELYETGRYVLANYVAGLAVECMLRAYRYRIDPNFDARHDVERLFKLAKFNDLVPAADIGALSAALGDVLAYWSNDHRFLSLAALQKRWADRGLYRGIKGSVVKELVRRTLNAAERIVATGAARWKSSFKN